MSTFTRNRKVILMRSSDSIYVGDSPEETKNILDVDSDKIVRGSYRNCGNRGVVIPPGTIANFAPYTAGVAPTDRLAIYQGAGNSTRIGTMVRATGGGKVAGSVYKGDSVEDADFLGTESAADDAAAAAAVAYLMLLQPEWGNPRGFATRFSSLPLKS